MFVEIFSICDAATDYNGRLNILGAFEGIAAQSAPIARERCSIAARLRFEASEAGMRKIEVRVIDASDREVIPRISAAIPVKMVPGRKSVAQNLVLNINRLQFPEFGDYWIQLLIDGTRCSQIPLLVAKAQKRSKARTPMEN